MKKKLRNWNGAEIGTEKKKNGKQQKPYREHWQTQRGQKLSGSSAVDDLDFPVLGLDEDEMNDEVLEASDNDYESNEEDEDSNTERCIKKKRMYCCIST